MILVIWIPVKLEKINSLCEPKITYCKVKEVKTKNSIEI